MALRQNTITVSLSRIFHIQPQSIQGDLGSWFGYDFDFDELDDNVRLFVGAPRQQTVYYSDYDVNEWQNARQLPQQLLYHEQHITTRFVGAVVRYQALIDPLAIHSSDLL